MVLRRMGTSLIGGKGAEWLRELNARHPWNHNDYFHSWVLANLPDVRGAALDVGCGRGGLVRALAPHFDHVVGIDADAEMRRIAGASNSYQDNVTVSDSPLDSWPDDSVDLVTMVAVLHHLDVDDALHQVQRVLTPRGRLLVVGLAPPKSAQDLLWDAASIVTNPLIGFLHHPWPGSSEAKPPPFPVKDPTMSFDEWKKIFEKTMPGAVMKHRIGFRHTIAWTKPGGQDSAE
ncbi:MAG: class I SAM-dependent methyltransferase [Rhodococcus sp. (in: high G+C Gram-positive bacteria)]|uniref:class I SAM-dependent methyltransferase n=1 Tax=Rhodococcus sp. TaxID=1831 RepID=UPI002AD5F4DF|nr:class I SAM-dependent methyltransferase [Rhodococcus sp. (in: high G+C Gram-positive bacteria)]